MPKLIDCEQGSAEWFQVRCGRITASRIIDVMAVRKDKKEAAARIDYRFDLMAERLTGQVEDNFVSREMLWGKEVELEARSIYERETDTFAEQIGFAIHSSMDYSGASADSLIDINGGLEIKSPKTTTHLEWMIGGIVPEEYRPQIYWNMACYEREWWDFMSFDPRIKDERLRSFIRRLYWSENEICKIEAEVSRFNDEIETALESLHKAKPTLIDSLRKSLEVA
jgi:putative phage-type endonuclease